MGLIATIGHNSPKTLALRLGILLLLLLGGISMAVPFLIMLSSSTRTGVDRHSFEIVPRFLVDDSALFRKYIEALYNESPASLRASWRSDDSGFEALDLLTDPDVEAVAAWRRFIAGEQFVPEAWHIGFTYAPVSRSRPLNVRRFLKILHREHGGDLVALNQQLETSFSSWNAFIVLPPDTRSRLGVEAETPWWRRWRTFVQHEAALWTRVTHDLEGYFHERITVPQLGRNSPRIALSARLPADPDQARLWELFVREALHPAFIRYDDAMTPLWQDYLHTRFVDADTYHRITGLPRDSWEAPILPRDAASAGPLAAEWAALLEGWVNPADGRRFQAPLDALSLYSPDLAWSALHGKPPPRRADDQFRFLEHKGEIRRAFLLQHYGTVWEILILHGRGLRNTVFYCAAAVLLALIVNPMAAYALSRFRPRHTYALLLYLLLTMAFPPMVTQIPVFLMLRDFNMLNTFWALLLPGMAHGYSIFLLKGFFDSLPRELYESASIDGAGELLMFRVITLSLSKPILAVIALGAFVNAYTAFMFALLICQDERMWTLMVWLHQLQQNYGPGVMNAAFVLAALPTLAVFLLAQQQILKGIVVPSEK
jgi:multiple sugar transport system permease protein